MGKKKDADFKKIKIKIGKSKPSNNVTKFNIKTAKIVIPGEHKKKIERNSDETFFSCNEKHLFDNLKSIQTALLESIHMKITKSLTSKLDLTQSFWRTIYKHKWETPWDDIIDNFNTHIGSMEIFCWTIFNNAISNKKLSINEEGIKCLNLYFKLMGDSSNGVSMSKRAIMIIKRYMKSDEKKNKLLALELALSLAKYCPFAFWYASRWRSAVFILTLIKTCLSSVDKIYDSLLDAERFLSITASIVMSVVDGRRAEMILVGEEASQLQDIKNPPFNDLYYEEAECIDIENCIVTDAYDKWEREDLELHSTFDLNNYLKELSNAILEMGIKMLPLTAGCEISLKKLLNIIKILCRCCLRCEGNKLWTEFMDKLITMFPLFIDKTPTAVVTNIAEVVEINNVNLKDMSKKERKLYKERMELEKRMTDLCRNAKTITNSKDIDKINEDINYHMVALVHQCLISDKMIICDGIRNWVNRLRQYLASRDWSRNELTLQWLSLGKQILRLAYERYNNTALIVSDLFIAFSYDMFINAHCASKVKRVALSIYVNTCLMSIRINDEQITYPMIDEEMWNILIDMIMSECIDNSNNGLKCNHPTFISPQIHYDITLIRSVYMLLQEKYPSIKYLFINTDIGKKEVLKQCFINMHNNIKQSQYIQPDNWQQFFNDKILSNLPNIFLWDYFTVDDVIRRDKIMENLRPLCSSIDDFLCQ